MINDILKWQVVTSNDQLISNEKTKKGTRHVNSKITMRELELKNRFVAEPMVSTFDDSNGTPTVKSMEIYSQYAKSGVGMVVVEQHAVHPWGRN